MDNLIDPSQWKTLAQNVLGRVKGVAKRPATKTAQKEDSSAPSLKEIEDILASGPKKLDATSKELSQLAGNAKELQKSIQDWLEGTTLPAYDSGTREVLLERVNKLNVDRPC